MKLTKALSVTFFLCIMFFAGTASAVQHAAYYRALNNLRAARWLINYQPQSKKKQIWADQAAAKHIQNAIEEINRYKITDDKPLDYHDQTPDIAARVTRLQNALDLLRKVRNDIKRNEDNVFGANLQERVIASIDLAISFTQQAISSKE